MTLPDAELAALVRPLGSRAPRTARGLCETVVRTADAGRRGDGADVAGTAGTQGVRDPGPQRTGPPVRCPPSPGGVRRGGIGRAWRRNCRAGSLTPLLSHLVGRRPVDSPKRTWMNLRALLAARRVRRNAGDDGMTGWLPLPHTAPTGSTPGLAHAVATAIFGAALGLADGALWRNPHAGRLLWLAVLGKLKLLCPPLLAVGRVQLARCRSETRFARHECRDRPEAESTGGPRPADPAGRPERPCGTLRFRHSGTAAVDV